MSGPPLDGYESARRRFPRARPPKDDGKPKCEHCLKPIRWAFPVVPKRKGPPPAYANKPKPFDYEPDDNGKFSLYEENGKLLYAELRAGQLPGWRAAGNATYMPHFTTCTKRGDWGQRGKAYGSQSVNR